MSDKRLKSKLISNLKQQCANCGSSKLMNDYDSAELVCMECGYVLKRRFADQGPEWRAFNIEQQEKRARTGAPATFTIHDKGLFTKIDWHDRDFHGKNLKTSQKATIYRIRKWNRRVRVSNSIERNLSLALAEISKISNKLTLPKSIFETASVIYRKTVKGRLTRGRSIQGMCAASIYVACRQCRITCSLEDISKASNLGKKEIGRSYRLIVKKMEYFVPPIKADNYVSKFSNKLVMKGITEATAHKLLVVAKRIKLTSGKGPKSLAVAACYIASMIVGERRTQREIAEVAGVTEVTIRNRYKELVNNLLFVICM
jgi:transcription initiation factor TFIIB